MLAFSVTFPATRLALPAFGATVTGLGRAVVAAAVAGTALLVWPAALPARSAWPRLALVSAGVVIGFPLLSALALDRVGAGHAAVLAGLLPAATAAAAVVRAGERPNRRFWLAAGAGLVTVLAFAVVRGAGRPQVADLLLLAAVAAAGIGYAEGAVLARTMPGWRVIAWALVLAAPILLPVSAYALISRPPRHPDAAAWLGLAYVALVSMFLGFVAWYRGLAEGGVARIGQLQLAQPVLTLGWAVLLLAEPVDPLTVVAALAVLAATAATQRRRVGIGAGAAPAAEPIGRGAA